MTDMFEVMMAAKQAGGSGESRKTAALAELVDSGAKNVLPNIEMSRTISGVKFTINADGSVSLNGTAQNDITSFCIASERKAMTGNMTLSGCPANGGDSKYKLELLNGGNTGTVFASDHGSGADVDWSECTAGYYTARIYIGAGQNVDGLVFRPMLCTKAAWDISAAYVPYGMANSELTSAAVKSDAVLSEMVDRSPKNKAKENQISFTGNSKSIEVESISGKIVLSWSDLTTTDTDHDMSHFVVRYGDGTNSGDIFVERRGGNVEVDTGTKTVSAITAYPAMSATAGAGDSMTISDFMVCSKADWDISQSYQPYRPNTVDAVFGPGTEIIGTDAEHQDLDNYTSLGVYFCRNSTNAGYVDNKPVGGSGFRLTVENISGTNTFRQTFIKPTDPSKIYVRHYSTSAWSAWYVFEGTQETQ
ncbi:MAG: hypothetical protein IKP42_09540 [Ruminococcus sp.]|nr:hypothetical protein [Ruminococcus sp.]